MESVQPFLGWLREHLFAVVFVASLVDATGLPFPGRAMLVVAGLSATARHDVVLLIMTSVLGSLLGDHVLYLAGRRGGIRLLALYCRLSLGSTRCVETALRCFKRFGAVAVLLARFSTSVRLFVGDPCRLGTDQLLAVPGPRRGRHRHLRDAVDRPRSHVRRGGAGAHRTLSRDCCSCWCPPRYSAFSPTGSFAAAGTAPPRTIWSPPLIASIARVIASAMLGAKERWRWGRSPDGT